VHQGQGDQEGKILDQRNIDHDSFLLFDEVHRRVCGALASRLKSICRGA
jgi:hypothetical protein